MGIGKRVWCDAAGTKKKMNDMALASSYGKMVPSTWATGAMTKLTAKED